MAASMEKGEKLKIKTSRHCCVPLCTSDSRYETALHFHHIPKDEDLKKQWIIKIRRDEGPLFKVTNATVVCSKHFTANDYQGWNPVRKKLKPNAVPSVFNWAVEKTPRRALKSKLLAPSSTFKTANTSSSDSNEPMDVGSDNIEREAGPSQRDDKEEKIPNNVRIFNNS